MLVVVLGLLGCAAQRVHVPPVPPDLTPSQRIETFQQWRARDNIVDSSTRCHGLLHGCTTKTRYTLVLARGVEVTEGDDLRPLLHPASPAGRAATSIVERRPHQQAWKWVAIGSVIVGCVLAGSAAVFEPDAKVPVLGLVGAGVIGSGGVGGYLVYRYHTTQIRRASGKVFEGYDVSLAQRLGVCVQGMMLVPCEGAR
jgi:hypothetical protein